MKDQLQFYFEINLNIGLSNAVKKSFRKVFVIFYTHRLYIEILMHTSSEIYNKYITDYITLFHFIYKRLA